MDNYFVYYLIRILIKYLITNEEKIKNFPNLKNVILFEKWNKIQYLKFNINSRFKYFYEFFTFFVTKKKF